MSEEEDGNIDDWEEEYGMYDEDDDDFSFSIPGTWTLISSHLPPHA
jgi:hypothetical protein